MNTNGLMASLLWSSIGSGFLIYGWRQREPITLFGGIALGVLPYFFMDAPLLMSVGCAAIIAGIFWLRRRF